MLGRLFKHDMKAIFRALLPCSFGMILISTLAGLSARFTFEGNIGSPDDFQAIFQMLSIFFVVLVFAAIAAATVFVTIVIYRRFYKNIFGDEGYLTLTLPVRPSSILWAKLLSAFFSFIIMQLVLLLCFFIFIVCSIDFDGLFVSYVVGFFEETFGVVLDIIGGYGVLLVIEWIVSALVSLIYSILLVYVSIMLGACLWKKHRVFCAILVFFGLTLVVAFINLAVNQLLFRNIAFNLFVLSDYEDMGYGIRNYIAAIQPKMIYDIVGTLGLSSIYFVVTNKLLKNKMDI